MIRGHGPAEDHRFQQCLFGMKVIVDRSQIYTRLGNDAAQGSSGIAMLGKKAFGGIEEALLGMVHRRLNQTTDYNA
jgi:hypothetical protein